MTAKVAFKPIFESGIETFSVLPRVNIKDDPIIHVVYIHFIDKISKRVTVKPLNWSNSESLTNANKIRTEAKLATIIPGTRGGLRFDAYETIAEELPQDILSLDIEFEKIKYDLGRVEMLQPMEEKQYRGLLSLDDRYLEWAAEEIEKIKKENQTQSSKIGNQTVNQKTCVII